jgi:probable HAF family extracellular repeat protein
MIDLGAFGGGYSSANGVNNSGQIVGYSSTQFGLTHAFLYQNGSMNDLGTLGGRDSNALGVNDSGQVVGYSFMSGDFYDARPYAFLYQNGQMVDLNTLLQPGFGTTLTGAKSINNSGQIIASGSDGHAYLLTPDDVNAVPAPPGVVLAGLGCLGMVGGLRLRRRLTVAA